MESGLSRTIEAAHASRLEVKKLFPDVHLERLRGARDRDGSSLWMEYILCASEGFNRSATTANSGMLSPHEVLLGGRPPIQVLPFCKSACQCVPRRSKMDPQAGPCFFLNFGYNHGSDCLTIKDGETGRVVHSRDVTWHQPQEPLISPASTVGSGVPHSSSGAETPEHVFIQWTSAATATPAAAPATATPVPVSAIAALTPLPTPPASIPDRIVRELGHEADVRMPGRTQGETSAMRDSHHGMGLMSQATLAQGLTTHKAFDEAFREYDLPKPEADLLTVPANDLPTPSTIAEGEASNHAEIWRGFRAREFSGLLQAHTFGLA